MKKFLLTTLTTFTALTVLSATSAFAQEVPAIRDSDEWIQTNETGKRVKRSSQLLLDHYPVTANGSEELMFFVPAGKGYLKVHYYNHGSVSVRVVAQKGHDNKLNYTVGPGEQGTEYTQRPLSTGKHTIFVYAPEGNNPSGVIIG